MSSENESIIYYKELIHEACIMTHDLQFLGIDPALVKERRWGRVVTACIPHLHRALLSIIMQDMLCDTNHFVYIQQFCKQKLLLEIMNSNIGEVEPCIYFPRLIL